MYSNEQKQYKPDNVQYGLITKIVLLIHYYSIINIINILISFYFKMFSFQFNSSLRFSNCVLLSF